MIEFFKTLFICRALNAPGCITKSSPLKQFNMINLRFVLHRNKEQNKLYFKSNLRPVLKRVHTRPSQGPRPALSRFLFKTSNSPEEKHSPEVKHTSEGHHLYFPKNSNFSWLLLQAVSLCSARSTILNQFQTHKKCLRRRVAVAYIPNSVVFFLGSA